MASDRPAYDPLSKQANSVLYFRSYLPAAIQDGFTRELANLVSDYEQAINVAVIAEGDNRRVRDYTERDMKRAAEAAAAAQAEKEVAEASVA